MPRHTSRKSAEQHEAPEAAACLRAHVMDARDRRGQCRGCGGGPESADPAGHRDGEEESDERHLVGNILVEPDAHAPGGTGPRRRRANTSNVLADVPSAPRGPDASPRRRARSAVLGCVLEPKASAKAAAPGMPNAKAATEPTATSASMRRRQRDARDHDQRTAHEQRNAQPVEAAGDALSGDSGHDSAVRATRIRRRNAPSEICRTRHRRYRA